jgi:hypothetical protein
MMKRSKMADGKMTMQVSVVTSKRTERKDGAADWLYSKDTTSRERKKSDKPVNGVESVSI